jgi:hypothetical protein
MQLECLTICAFVMHLQPTHLEQPMKNYLLRAPRFYIWIALFILPMQGVLFTLIRNVDGAKSVAALQRRADLFLSAASTGNAMGYVMYAMIVLNILLLFAALKGAPGLSDQGATQ